MARRRLVGLHRRLRVVSCPACGDPGTKGVVDARWPGYWLRCSCCGLVFVGNPLPQGVYHQVVESAHRFDGYEIRRSEEVETWRQWKLQTYGELGLLPWDALGVGGRGAVEFGAAEGKQSILLEDLGFHLVAVEPNIVLAGACRAAGIETCCAYFGDTHLPGGAFSLAVGTHVLEHLPDPEAALREIFRLLRPGGALLLEVPTSLDVVHPEHLHYFDRRSLSALLSRCGFAPRSWFAYRDQVFGLDNLALLALRADTDQR